ncbi:MAG: penicillin acylase family protein [Steroidobacteraceae bacterium]
MHHARFVPLCTLLVSALASAGANPPGQVQDQALSLPQLHGPARILRDVDGMPHIYAQDEHDAIFLQGWVTAQDRLFQIDLLRRQVSGTLAELVGSGALAGDVQSRTIGLRRASVRSLARYSPEMKAGLQAFADGVNAWVAHSGSLPAQYAALEITRFEPWTALDSAVIGKGLTFQLSFDLDIDATLNYLQYQAKLAPINPALPDGAYFGDVFRSAGFDPAVSVLDANDTKPFLGALAKTSAAARKSSSAESGRASGGTPAVGASTERMLRNIRRRYEAVPFLKQTLQRTELQIGSNEWAVAGSRTVDGRPLVANDPHLGLDLPATFYPVHLVAHKEGLDTIGSSIAGAPYVVLGQNRRVTWGETTTGFDVTDTYQERIQALGPDANGLPRFVTYYQGSPEPVTVIPVTFRVNMLGDGVKDNLVVASGGAIPPVVLTVPRRNNGPIVDLDIDESTGAGTAISVQYIGFSGTRELETFRLMNYARNLVEFKAALQYFDVGSQNFIYGDIDGNIGYFTSAEVPLREDLQAFNGAGLPFAGSPPWFIRNGEGGNEWLVDPSPDEFNGSGYQSLPFDELPQVVNPQNGFVVNANNDPAGVTLDNNPINQLRKSGQGVYYLGYAFDYGTRAGRITQALTQRLAAGPVSRTDMKAIQADVTLLDAQVLAPYIVGAFDNASAAGAPAALAALAADARVAEAVGRLRAWNYTTPTGALSGYDASDVDGHLMPPSASEVQHSIAATIYSVWRGQAIRNGVDLTLQGLGVPTPGSGEAIKALRHLVERNGIGLSTIDFFGWAAAAGLTEPAERRDYVMLKSLADALDRLAGAPFAAAFANSSNQGDYLWGKLHRITFDGVAVGGPYNIPGATPGFPPSFPGLPGLATDGGFGVVDASSHSARADSAGSFMFGSGPNRRYVGVPGTVAGSIDAETSLPGGASGVLGSPYYANLLGRWLTNDTYPLRQGMGEVMQNLASQQFFKPAEPGKSGKDTGKKKKKKGKKGNGSL